MLWYVILGQCSDYWSYTSV